MGRTLEQKKAQALKKRIQYAEDPEYRERVKERMKKNYQSNRTKVIERVKQYDALNRDKIREGAKARYRRNPELYRAQIAARVRDRKIRALLVLGNECVRCGWNEHPAALTFHHRDPEHKSFNISLALNAPLQYPWPVVEEEIKKCDLLCSCCHAIIESTWVLEGVWPCEFPDSLQANGGTDPSLENMDGTE